MRYSWIAIVFSAVSLLTLSCKGGQDPDPVTSTPVNPTQPTPYTPPDSPTPSAPLATKQSIKLLVKNNGAAVRFIELTEGGKYLIGSVDGENRHVYSFGDYTVTSDGRYVLGEDAELTFTSNDSSADFKLGYKSGTTVSGTADIVKNTKSSSNITRLCRSWTVTKTRVSITEGVKANADFNGCNLGEIAEFSRNQGIEIKKDLSGISVSLITLTPNGTAIILYSNGEIDVVSCDFSAIDDGAIKYSWQNVSSMGYEFTGGTGKVRFEGELCVLSLESSFDKDSKKYGLSVTIVMAEKK